jgi:hypothetical protein
MNSFVPLSEREEAILALMIQVSTLETENQTLKDRILELESELEFPMESKQ